jgi:hypothetical protein
MDRVIRGFAIAWVLLAVGVIAPGVGLFGGQARARSGVRYGVDIQAVFSRSGDPLLVANFVPDGSLAAARWTVCRPGGPCDAASRGGELGPGPEPAGTRLIATAIFHGRSYSASRTWLGRVRAVTGPLAAGRLRAGAVLNLSGGRWVGGWGTETDQLGAEACTTRSGHHCRMLAGGELGCPDASSHRRLGGWFTGAYLFALDARQPRDVVCAGTGYFSNADLPLWPPGPTVVRSAALGRIAGPTRPTVTILRHVQIAHGRALVAVIGCAARCRVTIEVSDGQSGASDTTRFRGLRRIGVPKTSLAPGPLAVQLHVDDGPLLQARSRL